MRHIARLLLIALSLSLAMGGLELLMRKVPGLIPLPVFYELPGGGRYLQPLVFDEPPIRTGFRYQPGLDLPFTFQPDDPSILGQQAEAIASPANPRSLSLHLRTDEDGFMNPPPASGEPYDIVVTGDSFLGLSSESHWLDLLAEQSGQRVRNLGMPGWGPQAEAAALAEYGMPNEPDWVLMAFFEGNDLWDAMTYEQHRESGLRWDEHDLRGSRLKDRLVLPAFARWQWKQIRRAGNAPTAPGSNIRYPIEVELGGRALELVFADLYVRRLSARAADIEGSRNLALTTQAIRSARATAEAAGARFGLVYIPSEPRVYLPLLGDEGLRRALAPLTAIELDAEGWLRAGDEGALSHARLTAAIDDQSRVIESFAAAEEIHFIDLSPAFRDAAARGSLLYNHVDTHWNDAGQALAAVTVEQALAGIDGEE